ncbi:MAG: hypothetical protein JNL58_31640 [Planctomyces sp.]|nr:hypothetical protein [Planctomyces sp.]
MMKKNAFDPIATLNILFSDVGFEWQLRQDFEDSRDRGGLSSSAHADLGTAIECILVGLGDAASQLLAKARKWATEAIDSENEPATWMTFQTLAMCDWLLENQRHSDTYRQFNDLLERSLEHPAIASDAVNVSLMLPGLVDGRSYERVLQVFERTKKLVESSSLDKISNEAQMCFVIAKHRLGHVHTKAEVESACDKFMLKNMDKWLGNGHSVRASVWLKIIWENRGDSALAPSDIVLKCYDYLRNCHRPF